MMSKKLRVGRDSKRNKQEIRGKKTKPTALGNRDKL